MIERIRGERGRRPAGERELRRRGLRRAGRCRRPLPPRGRGDVRGEALGRLRRRRCLTDGARVSRFGRTVATRTAAQEERRRQILDAAVRAFAKKGYHACRVSDIAEEAGVAYGLVYHYFESKDAVLEAIFREMWGMMVGAINAVESLDDSPREQLRKACAIVLRTWRDYPDVVRVLVREVARSGEQLQREVEEIAQAFRGAPADRRARPGEGRVPRPTCRRGSRRGSSTAPSRRSSPAGCSAGCRGRRTTSAKRSRPSSGSSATGSSVSRVHLARRSSPRG